MRIGGQRHGIFVGNCTSLLVEGNHIECERLGDAKRLTIDGIRVYGFVGRMAYVTQRHDERDDGHPIRRAEQSSTVHRQCGSEREHRPCCRPRRRSGARSARRLISWLPTTLPKPKFDIEQE
jgi:hypothetical protein